MAWCQRWTIDNNNWTSDSSINRNRINHILILVYVNVSILLYEGHITHKEDEDEEKKMAKRQQKAFWKMDRIIVCEMFERCSTEFNIYL